MDGRSTNRYNYDAGPNLVETPFCIGIPDEKNTFAKAASKVLQYSRVVENEHHVILDEYKKLIDLRCPDIPSRFTTESTLKGRAANSSTDSV